MKTQNTLSRPSAMALFAFAFMLAAIMLGAPKVIRAQKDANLGSIHNGAAYSKPGVTGYQETELKPSTVPGVFDLSFRVHRNDVLEPVSSLPIFNGPLVLFAHVEDTNGNAAQSGTVDFEYCGNYEPKENCESGAARWNRLGRMSIGSCYCRTCGGLPGYDPGPGNACIFVTGTGSVPGDDGFRFKYAGSRGGIDGGTSGAANFTWTAAP